MHICIYTYMQLTAASANLIGLNYSLCEATLPKLI